MSSNLKWRSPTVLTIIGVAATVVVALMVVITLLLTGGGKAVSDNAALIGALVALGGVFTTQMVNSALEDRRAQQARETEEAQRQRDRETEQSQRQRELEVGSQRAQDDAAQAYLDQMALLLLDKDRPLRHSQEGDEVRTLARARTLTVLSRLDGARRGSVVVQFLYESGLITKGHAVVALRGANLSGAYLGMSYLRDVDLSGAILGGAGLGGTDLRGADLSDAHLSDAYLGETDLRDADLSGADLSEVRSWTAEQLSAASSLEGATMPDGQTLRGLKTPQGPTFEDWIKNTKASEEAKEDE
jgi:hypothetical protein